MGVEGYSGYVKVRNNYSGDPTFESSKIPQSARVAEVVMRIHPVVEVLGRFGFFRGKRSAK